MKHEMIDIVGAYLSFPYEGSPGKWIELAKSFIEMTDEMPKRVRLSPVGGSAKRDKTLRMSEKNFERTWTHILDGDYNSAVFDSFSKDEDWAEGYRTGAQFSLCLPDLEMKFHSALKDMFGWSGNFILEYPIDWFSEGQESDFQSMIVSKLKEVFVKHELNWAFVNRGLIYVGPGMVGEDAAFLKTREYIPLTSFDYDLQMADLGFWRFYAKGAFWANFLNPNHIEELGGKEVVISEKPCSVIQELGDYGLLLQVGQSPIAEFGERVGNEYQRLRNFLRPILLEHFDALDDVQLAVISAGKGCRDPLERDKT